MAGVARERRKDLLFVTVGTTSFDRLVRAVLEPDVLDRLRELGIRHILIQIGRGEPPAIEDSEEDAAGHVRGSKHGMTVEYFRLEPSIRKYMDEATFVMSHAGAGSIFGALRQHAPLFVVVNEELMDNHQRELATALGNEGFLSWSTIRDLARDLRLFRPGSHQLLPEPSFGGFVGICREEAGLPDKED